MIAAHKNVFEQWGRGRSLDEHLEYRLHSPSHRRATWFVGCVDGAVVTSLGCYPIQFQVAGETMPGVAIGSVFTTRDFRRRGYAARLAEWVDAHHKQHGVGMSVLYSDIDPNYYAKCGYVLCPSYEGWFRPRDEEFPQSASGLSLVEFDVREEFTEVATMYAEYHGAAAISIVRDKAYWDSIIEKFPHDRYFWLEEPTGGRAAYVRTQQAGTTLRITDYALANRDDELAEELYATLLSAAATWDFERVGGWLPSGEAARRFFNVQRRSKEITMIKPLAYERPLTAAAIASTGYFCEIDHV